MSNLDLNSIGIILGLMLGLALIYFSLVFLITVPKSLFRIADSLEILAEQAELYDEADEKT